MNRDDRHNGTRGSRGHHRDNRYHRNHQELRQRNVRPQNNNYRPQHSVPVSPQYPADYRHFLNVYPSSAYSFMLPNMSVPPPSHPPPSNMWGPQWTRTESRDYRSFSMYSGQQQLYATGHASGTQEEVSRGQESIPGNLFNMPHPPVSSRVPMPMSELYPPSREMQTTTSGMQTPSLQTQASCSRTQTSSGIQSSTPRMQTSGGHTSSSELYVPTPSSYPSTSELPPTTSGTHSRRGQSVVPESCRTTSEYVSHTLIHRVTSDVQPSSSGLPSQTYPVVPQSQQSMFQSHTSGIQTPTTRRNSASPEIKSCVQSRSNVTNYTAQQSTSAAQSKSFYPENLFETQSGCISNKRTSSSKTNPTSCQQSNLGKESKTPCSENIYEPEPSTSGYISDRRSSTSETQSQTETDRSAVFSWLRGSLYVRPPRVIRVDVNEPEELPVSRFFEFVSCVKKTVFQHLFFDNSDEGRFVDALNMFLKLLSDVRTSVRVPDYLLNFLMRVIHVTSRYYRRISCSHEDEYLEIMEDVFIHYSEVVLALFETWDLTEETEKPGNFIGKITRMLLTRSMLRRIDNILNCLIKIETHPSLHFHCRFLINLYWVFLRYLNFKYTDENLIRMFVIWRKFELLWPDDLVKLRECRENQLRHGRRHVVLESIPLLNEMIEVSERDPRYSVRDVIAIYWWWWEITKDELRNKSEKARVNIIHFPKMCNSRYLAHKTPTKPPEFTSNLTDVKKERNELLLTKMAKHIKRSRRIDSTILWDLRSPVISSIQENNAKILTDCQWIFEPPIADTIEIHDSSSHDNEFALSVRSETCVALANSRSEAGRSVKLQKALKSNNTSHIQDIEILKRVALTKRQKVTEVCAEHSDIRRVIEHTPPDQHLRVPSPTDDSDVRITECEDPIKRQYHSELRQVSTSASIKTSRSIGIQSDQDMIKLDPIAETRSDAVKTSGKVTKEFIEMSNDSVQPQVDKSDSIRSSSNGQPAIQKNTDTFLFVQNDTLRDKICNGPMQVSEHVGDYYSSDSWLESTQRRIKSPPEESLGVFLRNRSSCIGNSQNVPVRATSVVPLEPEQASVYSKENDVSALKSIFVEEGHRVLTKEPEEREEAHSRSQKIVDKQRTAYVSQEGEREVRRSLENKDLVAHTDTLKNDIVAVLSENQKEMQSPDDKYEREGHHESKKEETKLCDKQSGESMITPGISKNSQMEKLTFEKCAKGHKEQRTCGVAKESSEDISEKTNSGDVFEEPEQAHVFEKTSITEKPEKNKVRLSVENQEKGNSELYKSSQEPRNSRQRKVEQMFEELSSIEVSEKEELVHRIDTEQVTDTIFEKKKEIHSRAKLHNVPKGLSGTIHDDISEQDVPTKTGERRYPKKVYSEFEEVEKDNCEETIAVSEKLSSEGVPEEGDHTIKKVIFPYEQPQDISSETSRENESILYKSEKSCYGKLEESQLHTVKLPNKKLEVGTTAPDKLEGQLENKSVFENTEKGSEEISKEGMLCVQAELYDVKNEGQEHDESSHGRCENRDKTLSVQIGVSEFHATTEELAEIKFDNARKLSRARRTTEMLEEKCGQIKKVILSEEPFRDTSVVTDTPNRQQSDDCRQVGSTLRLNQTKKGSQLQFDYVEGEAIFEKRSLVDDSKGKDDHTGQELVAQNKKSEDLLEVGASFTQNLRDENVFKNNSPYESLTTTEILDFFQGGNQEMHVDKASKVIGLEGTDKCIAIYNNLEKNRSVGESNKLEGEKVFYKVMTMYDGTDRIESRKEEDKPECGQTRDQEIQDTGQSGEVTLNTAQSERKKILGTKVLILSKIQSNEKTLLQPVTGEKISSESIHVHMKNLSPCEQEYLRQEGQQVLHGVPGDDIMGENDGVFYLSDFSRVFLSLDDNTPETTLEQFLEKELCMNKAVQFPEKSSSSTETSPFNNRLRLTKLLLQQVDSKIDLCTENKFLILIRKKDASSQREECSPKNKGDPVTGHENIDRETAITLHPQSKPDSLNNDNRTFEAVTDTRCEVTNVEGRSKDNNGVLLTNDRFVTGTKAEASEEFDKFEKIQQSSSVLELDEIKLSKLKKNTHGDVRGEQQTEKYAEKIVFEQSAIKSSELVKNHSSLEFEALATDEYAGIVRIVGDNSEGTVKLNVSDEFTQGKLDAGKTKPEQVNKCQEFNLQTEPSVTPSDEIHNIDDTDSIKMLKMATSEPSKSEDSEFASSKAGDKKKKHDKEVSVTKEDDSSNSSEGSRTSKQILSGIPKEKHDQPRLKMTKVPDRLHTVKENTFVMSEDCQGQKREKNVGKRKRRESGYCEETKESISLQQNQEHVKKIRTSKTHDSEISVASNIPFDVFTSSLEITKSSSELEPGVNINEIAEPPEATKMNNILHDPQKMLPSVTLLCEEPGMDTVWLQQTDSNDNEQLKKGSPGMDITLQQISSIRTVDPVSTEKVSNGQDLKLLLNDNNISLISADVLDKCVEKRGSQSEGMQPSINRTPQSVFSLNDESHVDVDKVLIRNSVHNFVSEMESWWPKTSGDEALPSEVLSDLFEESEDGLEDCYVIKPENSCADDVSNSLSYETVDRNEVRQDTLETQHQLSMPSSAETVTDYGTPTSSGGTTSALTSLPSRTSFSNPEKQLNIRDPRLAGKSEVARLYKSSQEVICNAICGSKLTDTESQVLPSTTDVDPSTVKAMSQPNTLASFYSTFVKEVSETDILSSPVPDDVPVEANVVIPISESQSCTLMSFDSQLADVTTFQNNIIMEGKDTTTEKQPLADSQSTYDIQSISVKRTLDNVLSDQGVGSNAIPHTFTEDKNSHNVKPTVESDVQLQGATKQTSSILKKHVDKIHKVDNDLHAYNSESTVIGNKKHSVTFFEEKVKEIYTREYGNQIETKGNQNSQIRTRKRMSKVQFSKDDSEGVKPKRRKRQMGLFKQLEVIDKTSRPHITAEDNDLFQNAIEGPVGKPMRSIGDTAPMMLWDDKDELCQTGTISVKSDSQLHEVKNENLVSVFKKPKSKDELVNGREYKGYKLSPSVDPKVLKEIVIRLTDYGIISNSFIQRYSNKRLRHDEVGAGERAKQVVQAEHEKVLERARMMELKEQQLKQETGILYCIFSDKWSWTEKNNTPKNNSPKSVTRKVRFKGETDDNHDQRNHRKGQKLSEKRKRNDHPEEVGQNNLKISVRTDLIEKTPRNPTLEGKDIAEMELTELRSRSSRSEKKLIGKHISDVKNAVRSDLIEKTPRNPRLEGKDISEMELTELRSRSSCSEKKLIGKRISDVKNGSPKLQTRSGRLRKKPSGKDYYDLTESTSNRRKSST